MCQIYKFKNKELFLLAVQIPKKKKKVNFLKVPKNHGIQKIKNTYLNDKETVTH